MKPVGFASVFLALVGWSLNAEADWGIEVVPVNWQVTSGGDSLRYLFDKKGAKPQTELADPFADLEELPMAVRAIRANINTPELGEGEWFDLKAALVDANPDWPPLSDDARFLVNRTQRLLYVAAPEEVLADVRRLPELIRRNSPNYWAVSCMVVRAMKPATFEPFEVGEPDLHELVKVEPLVTLFPTGLMGQSCEQTVAREADSVTGPIQAGVSCKIDRKVDAEGGGDLKLDLRFELQFEDSTSVVDLKDRIVPGRRLYRLLRDTNESVMALYVQPELRYLDFFPSDTEILTAKERWRELAGNVDLTPVEESFGGTKVESENGFGAFAMYVPPEFLKVYSTSEAISENDPFANLGEALEPLPPPKKLMLSEFEDLLGEGLFVDARYILEEVGIDFPPGACAIVNTNSWRLFVRNEPSELDLVAAYCRSGGVSVMKSPRHRFSFVESGGLDIDRLLFSVGIVTRSGVRGRSTLQNRTINQFLDLVVDPVIGADGTTVDAKFVFEGHYRDSVGAFVEFTHRSSHLYSDGMTQRFPILAIKNNQLDCHLFPEICYPTSMVRPVGPVEIADLNEALEQVASILEAESRFLP